MECFTFSGLTDFTPDLIKEDTDESHNFDFYCCIFGQFLPIVTFKSFDNSPINWLYNTDGVMWKKHFYEFQCGECAVQMPIDRTWQYCP